MLLWKFRVVVSFFILMAGRRCAQKDLDRQFGHRQIFRKKASSKIAVIAVLEMTEKHHLL